MDADFVSVENKPDTSYRVVGCGQPKCEEVSGLLTLKERDAIDSATDGKFT